MLQEKFSSHSSPRKSLRWLLVSLITAIVLVFSQGAQIALADLPPWADPPDRTPPVEPGEPPYVPFTNGFDWSVPSRFGRDDNQDGLIDYHYNSATFQYEKSLLYPESWPMIFDGCRTEQDSNSGVSATNTYQWVLNGETILGNKCRFAYGKDSPNVGNLGFPAQGTYPVDLTVTYGEGITSPTGQNPETFHQDVVVRDLLIVSLGDSYASGEGNPDIPQRYHIEWGFPIWEADAVWQDKRCHRSAKASPALAALAIERMDPKTSVTFISYACSGATLGTELFDKNLIGLPDANQSRGVGILEPYKGQDVPEPYDYSNRAEGWVGYIPSQIGQLKDVLIPPAGKSQRQIDALTVSGGGNDAFFADWMAACLLTEPCWDLAHIMERPDAFPGYTPREIVNRALGIVPGREVDSVPENYDRLAVEIGEINPAPLNVYVTQYSDGTTADDGGYCRMLDDILWPNPAYAITWWEAEAISTHAVRSLNATVFQEVKERKSQGWVYVDGMANYIQSDEDPNGPAGLFYGHGYCARQNWIVRAEEGELAQGPLYHRDKNTGTAHPNSLGNQAIRDRLLNYMLPRLFPQPPANPPAIGAPLYGIGGLVDVPGANGWYTGSCQEGACYPKAVMQVVGTAEAGVDGAGVMINGVNACTVSGVTCRTDGGLSGDKKQYTWNIELNADGIYNIQFNLRDKAGATATGSAEIKVDLHDPALVAPGPFTVNEGGTVVLEASVHDNEGSLVSLTWDLDNNGEFETYDQKPTFSAASLDGPTSQLIKVKATDQAGRAATAEAVINVANVEPWPEITGLQATNPEGTAMIFGAVVSDPGTSDTFTYDWSMSQGETVLARGTDPEFRFTPLDNGAYVVSLKVTDDDGGAGTASQTVDVVNVAPAPTIKDVQASNPEGTVINLSSTVSDPGASDTFTYDWSVSQSGTVLSTGSNSTFSFTPQDNGAYLVSLKVKDDDGGEGSTSQTIQASNVAPALSKVQYSPATVDEGGSVTVSGSITDPGAKDSLTLAINWGDGSAEDSQSLVAGTTSFTASHTYADDNPSGTASDSNTITVKVTDKDAGSDTKTSAITVNNLAPSLSLTGPAAGTLYKLNDLVSVTATLTDPSASDSLSCSVNWNDGSTTTRTLGAGSCSASHTYTATGVYTIQMTGSDDDTGSDTKSLMVVVYDPSAGFVTGGGWISSPAGAYQADESLSGKATFGFVSRYLKGASVPSGNTAFHFDIAGMSFASTSYDWLVVNQGGTNAQFKGSGLINGTADPNGKTYKFMLWAGDSTGLNGADTFRIRIWWEDAGLEKVVYDNGVDQPIGGGSIVVHTSK